MTQSFDVFFDLRLNKSVSKQSWGWWFETPPSSLWYHCNELIKSKTKPWWRHDVETLSVLLAFSARNPVITGGSPYKGSAMQNFDGYFIASRNKSLNRRPSCPRLLNALMPMWRHCNMILNLPHCSTLSTAIDCGTGLLLIWPGYQNFVCAWSETESTNNGNSPRESSLCPHANVMVVHPCKMQKSNCCQRIVDPNQRLFHLFQSKGNIDAIRVVFHWSKVIRHST